MATATHSRIEQDGLATFRFLHSGRQVTVTCEAMTRVDECLSQGRFYEHKLLGYITRVASSGVFLDVGGNCGHHSVYFALFTPSTKVITFEPLPEHVNLIFRNIQDNGLERKVMILPFGASCAPGQFRMDTNAAGFAKRITGMCMPIDEFVREPVTLMKVDVEGMELEALRGAQRILATDKPRIFVECLTLERLTEVESFLSAFGYHRGTGQFSLAATYEFVCRA